MELARMHFIVDKKQEIMDHEENTNYANIPHSNPMSMFQIQVEVECV
jgi:hypothetical protein